MNIKEKKLNLVYKGSQLEIAYFLRWGKKKNIIYVHGLGCAKLDFLGAFNSEGLRDYTLLAFDFPGCGGSSYPDNHEFDMDDLVEITHLVVSTLDMGKFVLMGHSMGGLVALLYSQKYNGDVDAFINVEGNLAKKDCFISLEMMAYDFAEFKKTKFPGFKKKMEKSNNTGCRRYAEILQEYSSPQAFYDYCPSLVRYSKEDELLDKFLELRVPTLFVYGSKNKKKIAYLPKLEQAGCEIAEIPGSGHFPNYDNPEGFYRVISEYID